MKHFFITLEPAFFSPSDITYVRYMYCLVLLQNNLWVTLKSRSWTLSLSFWCEFLKD